MTTNPRATAALALASLSLAAVALGGTAYAADGGNLIIGAANTATRITSLTSTNTATPALRVTNSGGQPAATFTVKRGVAPFSVVSTTRVDNLNADQLDGVDSSQFLRADTTPVFADVSASTTIQASAASNVVLDADVETYDPSGMHAGSDPQLVAPKAGTYVAAAVVDWDANGAGYRRSSLVSDAGTLASVAGPALPTPAFTSQNISGVVHLNAGQTVEVVVLQGSGGPLGVRLNKLQLTYVGP